VRAWYIYVISHERNAMHKDKMLDQHCACMCGKLAGACSFVFLLFWAPVHPCIHVTEVCSVCNHD